MCGAVSVPGIQTHMPLVSSNGVSLQIAWPHLSSSSNLAALLHLQYDSQSTSWEYQRSYGWEFSVAQLWLAPYLSRMWAGHILSWFFFCLWTLACFASNFACVSFNVFYNIFAFFCWTVCWYVCMFTFDCLCDFRRWWPFWFWAFEYSLSRRLPCFGLLCLQGWEKGWKYGWYWAFFQKMTFLFWFCDETVFSQMATT